VKDIHILKFRSRLNKTVVNKHLATLTDNFHTNYHMLDIT